MPPQQGVDESMRQGSTLAAGASHPVQPAIRRHGTEIQTPAQRRWQRTVRNQHRSGRSPTACPWRAPIVPTLQAVSAPDCRATCS